MDLDGRVCVVTGAASGIGEEIARQFGARGAAVAIVDIRAEMAGQVAEQITEKGPGSAAEFSCDLRSVQEIEAVLAAINARFGRLDVVVNVAGLANRTPVEDITEAIFFSEEEEEDRQTSKLPPPPQSLRSPR